MSNISSSFILEAISLSIGPLSCRFPFFISLIFSVDSCGAALSSCLCSRWTWGSSSTCGRQQLQRSLIQTPWHKWSLPFASVSFYFHPFIIIIIILLVVVVFSILLSWSAVNWDVQVQPSHAGPLRQSVSSGLFFLLFFWQSLLLHPVVAGPSAALDPCGFCTTSILLDLSSPSQQRQFLCCSCGSCVCGSCSWKLTSIVLQGTKLMFFIKVISAVSHWDDLFSNPGPSCARLVHHPEHCSWRRGVCTSPNLHEPSAAAESRYPSLVLGAFVLVFGPLPLPAGSSVEWWFSGQLPVCTDVVAALLRVCQFLFQRSICLHQLLICHLITPEFLTGASSCLFRWASIL